MMLSQKEKRKTTENWAPETLMVPYKKRPAEKKPGIIPYPKEKVAPLCRSIAPEAGQPSFYALALPQFKYFLHRCVPLQIGRPWLPSQHLEEREKKQDGPFCKRSFTGRGIEEIAKGEMKNTNFYIQ